MQIDLGRAILKNLSHFTLAFIELFSGIRSNYGGLTLAGIATLMCIKMRFKHRYKKLNRFLDNKYFDPNSLSLIMINLALTNYKEKYVIVIIDQSSKEPWYLIFSANSDINFSAEDVVMLYKRRMQIEQGFRDWKTHLGLRKLNLQVRKAEMILRLLMAFSLAYILVMMMGSSKWAESLREFMETARKYPKNNTSKILSALTLGLSLLGNSVFSIEAWRKINEIIYKLTTGNGIF